MDFAKNPLTLTELEVEDLEKLNDLIKLAFAEESSLEVLERLSDEAICKLKNKDRYLLNKLEKENIDIKSYTTTIENYKANDEPIIIIKSFNNFTEMSLTFFEG